MHFIVLIFGFTGILGALISLSSPQLVWYRMGIAFVVLLGFAVGTSRRAFPPGKAAWRFLGTGFIIAAHWITFFEAIKVANVSATLATMSSATLFTALLEPLFFRRRIHWYEVVLGGVMIGGLVMIFQFEPDLQFGILFALLSAFLAALFTVINGRFIKRYAPVSISLYEMAGGTLLITLYLLLRSDIDAAMFMVPPLEFFYIFLLGSVCTAFAFVASVRVMRSLSPFTVALTINMEPVYGILLAFFIFGESERMTPGFYAGAVVIIAAMFANSWLKKRREKPIGNSQ